MQEDENKLAYTKIHEQFSTVVEGLLEQHLSEIGLSAEDFVAVCEAAPAGSQLHTAIFEQILAVDDFLTFKTLMVRRNAELELEAVKQLAQNLAVVGRAPPVASALAAEQEEAAEARAKAQAERDIAEAIRLSMEGTGTAALSPLVDQDAVLKAAIEASMLDDEYVARQAELEMAHLEAAIAASLAIEEEQQRLQRENAAGKDAVSAQPVSSSSLRDLPAVGAGSSVSSTAPSQAASAGTMLQSAASASHPGTAAAGSVLSTVMGAISARPAGTTSSSASSSSSSGLPLISSSSAASRSGLPSIGAGRAGAGGGSASAAAAADLDALLSGSYDHDNSAVDDDGLYAGRRQIETALDRKREEVASLRQRQAKKAGEGSEVEVKQRQEHLRAMRDSLRSKKKDERDRALAEATDAAGSSDDASAGAAAAVSPSTKKQVATAIAAVRSAAASGGDDGEGEVSEEDKRRAMRLALAQKIKADVIAAAKQ